MTTATDTVKAAWDGPGAAVKRVRLPFRWRRMIWALIYPRREQGMTPTLSGVLLIGLSLGIGMAAYNSSNNILFITLALMLACLILSGVLAWINFSRVRWRIEPPMIARAGQAAAVSLELVNGKSELPTYGLECVMRARAVGSDEPWQPKSTLTGKNAKAVWKQSNEEKGEVLRLTTRLDPQEPVELEWEWIPPRRGRWQLGVRQVASLFPFGFFKKRLAANLEREITVWPAPREYEWLQTKGRQGAGGTMKAARVGQGSDLLALRRYETGDSHRLIHWKASARTKQLLVRQFSDEVTENYIIWVRTKDGVWDNEERGEAMIAFAATLAEDLFRAGKLQAVCLDDGMLRPIRHWRDMESWLDLLARVELRKGDEASRGWSGLQQKRNLITFAPEGALGVIALIDGEKAATA